MINSVASIYRLSLNVKAGACFRQWIYKQLLFAVAIVLIKASCRVLVALGQSRFTLYPDRRTFLCKANLKFSTFRALHEEAVQYHHAAQSNSRRFQIGVYDEADFTAPHSILDRQRLLLLVRYTNELS